MQLAVTWTRGVSHYAGSVSQESLYLPYKAVVPNLFGIRDGSSYEDLMLDEVELRR